jgi:hypothetical protein
MATMRVQSVVGDSWSRTRVAALSDFFKRDISTPDYTFTLQIIPLRTVENK